MLRVYYKSNRKETEDKKAITTIHGGHWFSEDCDSERHTYSIQRSYSLKSGLFLQVLTVEQSNFSENEAFIQNPLLWSLVRKSQEAILLVREGVAQLSFPAPKVNEQLDQHQLQQTQPPCQQPPLLSQLEPWVLEELGDLRIEIEALLQSSMSSLPFQGQSVPLQPEQQHQGHQEASPSQKKRQDQPFVERQVSRTQEALKQPQRQHASTPHQQHQGQPFASGVPKGVKTGSLCQPTSLPVGQPPRKSPYHPQEYRRQPGQTHQTTSYQDQCRINLADS
jgi:hypothetical protein